MVISNKDIALNIVLVLCSQYCMKNLNSVVNDYDKEFFEEYTTEQLERIELLLEKAIKENKALYHYTESLEVFYPDEKTRAEMIEYFNGGNNELKMFGVATL